MNAVSSGARSLAMTSTFVSPRCTAASRTSPGSSAGVVRTPPASHWWLAHATPVPIPTATPSDEPDEAADRKPCSAARGRSGACLRRRSKPAWAAVRRVNVSSIRRASSSDAESGRRRGLRRSRLDGRSVERIGWPASARVLGPDYREWVGCLRVRALGPSRVPPRLRHGGGVSGRYRGPRLTGGVARRMRPRGPGESWGTAGLAGNRPPRHLLGPARARMGGRGRWPSLRISDRVDHSRV